MHKNVEQLIGRLVTDAALRRRFALDTQGVLAEALDLGVELTPVEIAALAAIEPKALDAFAGTIDRRLQRAAQHKESGR